MSCPSNGSAQVVFTVIKDKEDESNKLLDFTENFLFQIKIFTTTTPTFSSEILLLPPSSPFFGTRVVQQWIRLSLKYVNLVIHLPEIFSIPRVTSISIFRISKCVF